MPLLRRHVAHAQDPAEELAPPSTGRRSVDNARRRRSSSASSRDGRRRAHHPRRPARRTRSGTAQCTWKPAAQNQTRNSVAPTREENACTRTLFWTRRLRWGSEGLDAQKVFQCNASHRATRPNRQSRFRRPVVLDAPSVRGKTTAHVPSDSPAQENQPLIKNAAAPCTGTPQDASLKSAHLKTGQKSFRGSPLGFLPSPL